MTLLKPTRRDIVKAAAERARFELHQEGQALQREAGDLRNGAESERRKNADKVAKRHTRKMQPLCDRLNDILEQEGFGRPISVSSTFTGCVSTNDRVGKPLSVCLHFSKSVAVQTNGLYPADTDKIKNMLADADRKNREGYALMEKAHNLSDQDVISGSINQALNGESAAALEVLVKNIKEVVIGQESLRY